MKRCGTCGESKPLDDFHRRSGRADGRQNRCKSCAAAATSASYAAHRDERRARRAARYAENRDAERERARVADSLKRHGEPPVEPGPCAICGTVGPLVRDHDHRCCPARSSCESCRRGLLCSRCNVGVGMLGDDADRLEAAAQYLRRHRSPEQPDPTRVSTAH